MRADLCGGAAGSGARVDSGQKAAARRRVVTVEDACGVFVRRGGCWVLGNEAELRLLEALGGSEGARGRLLALAAALDAGAVGGGDLRRLSRLLGEMASGVPCLVRVPGHLLGAVAYACAFWDSAAGWGWLGWALSARLDANLVREWMPGPGWESRDWEDQLLEAGFGREVHWISEMSEGFWQRLGSHPSPCLRDAVAASDPGTSGRVLAELAGRDGLGVELLDLVASHPRTPKRVLEEIASDFWGHAGLRVAQNLSAGRRVLSRLAQNPDRRVRFAVALNPNTPSGVRAAMAGDECADVRVAVAKALDVDPEALRVLGADGELGVRSWAAANLSTPAAVLETLLGDRSATVRACAAANPAAAAAGGGGLLR